MRRDGITEPGNPAVRALDAIPTIDILRIINREDGRVANAVRKVLPQIARAVDLITKRLLDGGRLIYLGAGTSGRLGVLDAAECSPTFGTNRVVGVMAGGPRAFAVAKEVAEDHPHQAVEALRRLKLNSQDVLVGISASGETPYTIGGMRYARKMGAAVIALTTAPRASMTKLADIAIVPVVGREVIAGSTRMKAGTAQKLVLNMLSTASMVRSGRVLANWMINVQARNQKLRERACRILAKAARVPRTVATKTLTASGGQLPVALLMLWNKSSRREAEAKLKDGPSIAGVLRAAQQDWLRSLHAYRRRT